jgi:hypothetical protein
MNCESAQSGECADGCMTSADLSEHGEKLAVEIPLRIRRRGGRKIMLAPEGTSAWTPARSRVDSAMVKAIARAHRWQRMLESGAHATITELAAAELRRSCRSGR